MSLAQIKEKIKADAEGEAKRVVEKARTRAESIKKSADEEVARFESLAKEKLAKERPEVFKRRNIVANLDVKRAMLGARRHLIQDVFDVALKTLTDLPETEYLAFCEKLLLQASKTGDEEMQVAEKERYLTVEWLAAFNAKHGKKIKMASKKMDASGGFLLSHGRIYTNCSWESLIQIMRENRETDVVTRLFPRC